MKNYGSLLVVLIGAVTIYGSIAVYHLAKILEHLRGQR